MHFRIEQTFRHADRDYAVGEFDRFCKEGLNCWARNDGKVVGILRTVSRTDVPVVRENADVVDLDFIGTLSLR